MARSVCPRFSLVVFCLMKFLNTSPLRELITILSAETARSVDQNSSSRALFGSTAQAPREKLPATTASDITPL